MAKVNRESSKKIQLEFQYSGKNSKAFWGIVNSLPQAKKEVAYALGVALQNLEHQVLMEIYRATKGKSLDLAEHYAEHYKEVTS